MTYQHHALDEDHFSYVAVSGTAVELKVGESSVRFSLDTADDIIQILTGYVQDRHQIGESFFEWLEQKTEKKA